MPVIPKPKTTQIFQEDDSVMDSAPVRMLRSVGKFLGLDDPNSDIMGSINPTPLVSIFKDKIARKLATDNFVEKMKGYNSPNLEAAGNLFAERYPRIAAHINPSSRIDNNPTRSAAIHTPNTGAPNYRMIMEISERGLKGADLYPQDARQLIFHEGTHAAQALGNSDFGRLYNQANKLVGYKQNPFEVSAREAGVRNMYPEQMARKFEMPTAIESLKNLIKDPKVVRNDDQIDAAMDINHTFHLRENPGTNTIPTYRIPVGETKTTKIPSIPEDKLQPKSRAAKGLVKGIKGWSLPDGKVARPVSDGVNRIFEGDDAAKALYRMQEPVSKEFARNPMPPAVSHPSHLPDVSVPIPDSLDTNVAAGFPSVGKWQTGRNQAAKRTVKANETIVRDMRALYDTGLKVGDIKRLYPDFNESSISEIVRRLTWARVK